MISTIVGYLEWSPIYQDQGKLQVLAQDDFWKTPSGRRHYETPGDNCILEVCTEGLLVRKNRFLRMVDFFETLKTVWPEDYGPIATSFEVFVRHSVREVYVFMPLFQPYDRSVAVLDMMTGKKKRDFSIVGAPEHVNEAGWMIVRTDLHSYALLDQDGKPFDGLNKWRALQEKAPRYQPNGRCFMWTTPTHKIKPDEQCGFAVDLTEFHFGKDGKINATTDRRMKRGAESGTASGIFNWVLDHHGNEFHVVVWFGSVSIQQHHTATQAFNENDTLNVCILPDERLVVFSATQFTVLGIPRHQAG